MNGRLSFRIFAHSWISDWNHGNAHFLRGLANELVKLGHEVCCYEERNGWSITNLATEGQDAVARAEADFHRAFPNLKVRTYTRDWGFHEFLKAELAGALPPRSSADMGTRSRCLAHAARPPVQFCYQSCYCIPQ